VAVVNLKKSCDNGLLVVVKGEHTTSTASLFRLGCCSRILDLEAVEDDDLVSIDGEGVRLDSASHLYFFIFYINLNNIW
jgi:hypothetical protein